MAYSDLMETGKNLEETLILIDRRKVFLPDRLPRLFRYIWRGLPDFPGFCKHLLQEKLRKRRFENALQKYQQTGIIASCLDEPKKEKYHDVAEVNLRLNADVDCLEKACEQLAKAIKLRNRNKVHVSFAGLVYHLFFDFDSEFKKELQEKTGCGTAGFNGFRSVFPNMFGVTAADTYVLLDSSIYFPIRLFDRKKKVDTSFLPVHVNEHCRVSPKTYLGGLIDLYYNNERLMIYFVPQGKVLPNNAFTGFWDYFFKKELASPYVQLNGCKTSIVYCGEHGTEFLLEQVLDKINYSAKQVLQRNKPL